MGFLSCMALWITFFTVQEMGRLHSIAQTRSVGLASAYSIGWDPVSLYRQRSFFPTRSLFRAASYYEHPIQREDDVDSRKVVRKGSLQLFVKDPSFVNDEVQRLTRSVGGFVASASRTDENSRDENAALEVRIPAERFDEVRRKVNALAIRVESEQIEASDVTKQYVDLDAALRNYMAEEERYREVLKQARSVKDILAVTAPLEDVRAKVEKAQGELQFLRHQVDMSSLQIGLRAEAETKVFGISWRPLHVAKRAFHETLEGLVSYADFFIAFSIKLPVILLWLFSIGAIVWLGYNGFRWILKKLSAANPAPSTENA